MKKAIIILFVLVNSVSFAQEVPVKRNTVYCELFGQGIYNSFSFDRLYRTDKKIKSSLSIGATVLLASRTYMNAFGVPVSYNWLIGKNNSKLELGTGITLLSLRYFNAGYNEASPVQMNNYYFYFTPKIGYRYQRDTGGFFFRATLTPMVSLIYYEGPVKFEGKKYADGKFSWYDSALFPAFPWAGFSFGYTIK